MLIKYNCKWHILHQHLSFNKYYFALPMKMVSTYENSNSKYVGKYFHKCNTPALGYRPFRLAWWILGLIAVFTVIYYLWIPKKINQYIFKKVERNVNNTNTIIHCLYFSSMVVFTFRLKRDILTFFDKKEKRVIVIDRMVNWIFNLPCVFNYIKIRLYFV